MKFAALTSLLCAVTASLALPSARTTTAKVTYDQTYDNPNGSLNSVACSNGVNGLITKGMFPCRYTDFSSLPNFPFIGGVQGVSWNSTLCGSCWELTYNGTTIDVLAVDYAAAGFNIALEALDQLTYDQAVALGHVDAEFEQVSGTKCGLPA
ncbi:hypothetical protein PHLCEN_2v7220 [Hermanssonia centrifuga]|uniref:Cerato-platanin n=1 Tax=Hermanssonia centrifuga TaxID=98765 RepID=A0A2R6NXA1_9APHY|nr:hypothetical protein PHLCEN_2v7220 [Hermanssonia centrifuga]